MIVSHSTNSHNSNMRGSIFFWMLLAACLDPTKSLSISLRGPRAAKTTGLRMASEDGNDETSVNVLGTPLQCCCGDVRGTGIGTGFYRNGYCSTGEQDLGRHTVCTLCLMTAPERECHHTVCALMTV